MATAIKLRSDIKKLNKALETKGISDSIKSKLKAQLDKAEAELAAMKKTGKPAKKSSTAGTQKTLTALQKLIQKKRFQDYGGKKIDLKKDASQGAFSKGRRVSKGLKSNQFGDKKSNKGNVYYEYRANRYDVKQPPKRYPKLDKGGSTSDAYKVEVGDEVITIVKNRKEKSGYPVYVRMAGYAPQTVDVYKSKALAEMKARSLEKNNKMAGGGYMAGGGIGDNKQGFVLYRGSPSSAKKFYEHLTNFIPDSDITMVNDDKVQAFITAYEYDLVKNEAKRLGLTDSGIQMAQGGYMARGGEASSKNYKVQYNVGKSKYVISYYDGEKKHKDGSPFYDVAIFKNMKDFMDYKKMLKSKGYKEMSQGGYMAKGGRIMKDWNGRKSKENWGKNDLYNMYSNHLDLVADVHDYYKNLATDIDENYAQKMKNEMIEILQNGKKNFNDGATLTFAKGGYMEGGGEAKGKNGYIAFYKDKKMEVYADTKYEAQLKAAKLFNAKKSYDVDVVLAEVGGKEYLNSTMMSKGGEVKVGDILTASTGVKVKVVEYDPKFGGRVRVERMDEYGTGKPSQFMPLSKFKYEKGGYMATGGQVHRLEMGK